MVNKLVNWPELKAEIAGELIKSYPMLRNYILQYIGFVTEQTWYEIYLILNKHLKK